MGGWGTFSMSSLHALKVQTGTFTGACRGRALHHMKVNFIRYLFLLHRYVMLSNNNNGTGASKPESPSCNMCLTLKLYVGD